MAPRARILAFGSAAVVVGVGALCGLLIAGFAADVVALSLITVGLGAVLLLVFYEIGLSEDKERAAQERRRARGQEPRSRPRLMRRPRRPG